MQTETEVESTLRSTLNIEASNAISTKSTTAAATKIVNNTTEPNSTVAFFKIERDNKHFFILGTDHAAHLKDLPQFILKIIKTEVKSLVVESPSIDKLNEKEKIERLQRMGILTIQEDHVWHTKLSSESLTVLNGYIAKGSRTKSLHLKLSQINSSLALLLIGSILQEGGIDDELEQLFQNNCFSLDVVADYNVELETNTVEELDESLKNVDELEKSFHDVASYLNGTNISDPEAVASCEQDVNLTVNRNIHWLPKIIDYFEKLPGPVLFAVGQDHLPGMTGLLQLLKRCSFKISRMNANGLFASYETKTSGIHYSEYIDIAISDTIQDVIHTTTHLPPEPGQLITEYLGDLVENNPSILNHYKIKREKESPENVEIYFDDKLSLRVIPQK